MYLYRFSCPEVVKNVPFSSLSPFYEIITGIVLGGQVSFEFLWDNQYNSYYKISMVLLAIPRLAVSVLINNFSFAWCSRLFLSKGKGIKGDRVFNNQEI